MPKVKIYTTPTCVYCKMAKEFFGKHNVQYEELNVATDMKAREEMINRSHQLGVPVIDVDGEIYVGFDRAGLAKALNIEA
ncbi:NrdH-redoxin [Candidatus Parcubacteria bacterium]|nr:MAG: NrdH-redoxin [Candidatus Parcubacteria bacterium]